MAGPDLDAFNGCLRTIGWAMLVLFFLLPLTVGLGLPMVRWSLNQAIDAMTP